MTRQPSKRAMHLVVLAHPSASSFNRSIADTYCRVVRDQGQDAELRDLYALGFDPLLKEAERTGNPAHRPAKDITAELDLLDRAAIVTLVYPIWFGMPPAMLKGYVDRVLGFGVPASGGSGTESVLRAKRMMIFSTSASTRPWLDEIGQWEALRHAFDHYLARTFGLARCDHHHFDAITPALTARYALECLAQVEAEARQICSDLHLAVRPRNGSASVIGRI